jgi:hypothetical protein
MSSLAFIEPSKERLLLLRLPLLLADDLPLLLVVDVERLLPLAGDLLVLLLLALTAEALVS